MFGRTLMIMNRFPSNSSALSRSNGLMNFGASSNGTSMCTLVIGAVLGWRLVSSFL